MKRKNIVTLHFAATIVAAFTIATFFSLSLVAEIKGDTEFIKAVKALILCALPVMVISMPILKISGDKLAGKSQNPIILAKKRKMKLMLINGICLISLAIFLYYRSHYQQVDGVFLVAQVAEFVFGLGNLTLIILNAKSGMQLSGKLKR